jgi:membrane protease YdiL (CAAX protease family)
MGKREKLFIIWSIVAIILAIGVSSLLEASFPLFTLIWIGVPLIVVLRTKDAGVVGFKAVPLKEFIKVTSINLGLTLAIIGVFEPWLHTYQNLLLIATNKSSPDATFALLIRFSGFKSLAGMFLFSGIVTMFGEELFFRGMLLQFFKKRLGSKRAVIIQAILFMLLNTMAALFMSPLQGLVYVLIYTGIAVSSIGGWSANKTGSFLPSLVSASVVNLIMVLLLF